MKSQRGFTLIEILIALVIVAILGAIAVPSYRNHVIKTRRVAATVCLMELAQWMERFYTVNLRYDQKIDGTKVALPTTLQCQKDLNSYYSFDFKKSPPSGSTSALSSKSYTLVAMPNMTTQPDKVCGDLTLNEKGEKGIGDLTGDPTLCWK